MTDETKNLLRIATTLTAVLVMAVALNACTVAPEMDGSVIVYERSKALGNRTTHSLMVSSDDGECTAGGTLPDGTAYPADITGCGARWNGNHEYYRGYHARGLFKTMNRKTGEIKEVPPEATGSRLRRASDVNMTVTLEPIPVRPD